MTQAIITRDCSIALTEADKITALKVVTQGLRGVDQHHHQRWTGYLRRLFGMAEGEVAEIGGKIPRCGAFHRSHMALEQAVFSAQQRFDNVDMFRNWLKIGCGFVAWVPGPKGGVVPLPKSISYASLSEAEMRVFHDNLLAFLRGPHAAPYLWKRLSVEQATEKMAAVLMRFNP